MNEPNNVLVAVYGLPCSGKSRWARGIREKYGCPIVDVNSIKLAMYKNIYVSDTNVEVLTLAKYMVESLFLAGHKAVVLDACNTTVDDRKVWTGEKYYMFRTHHTNLYTTYFHYVHSNIANCKEKARAAGHPYLLHFVDEASKTLQGLSSNERVFNEDVLTNTNH